MKISKKEKKNLSTIKEAFTPGDLMVITDHINLTGENPLIGANIEEHGPRFVDMTETYSKRGQA